MSEQRAVLLKEWARLAPGECQIDGGFVRYLPQGQGRYTDFAVAFEAFLLSALIHAIRARGWHCKLGSDEPGLENKSYAYWYVATVQWRYNMAKSEPFRELRSDETAEPCDALLAAYCAALQALDATEKP